MSVSASCVIPPAPEPRGRSIEARRAAHLDKARRERRIVALLNRGLSMAEIAAREAVTEKRMRAVVREILARRMPEAPADYAALQASRLNEALLVAMSAMSGTNLRAVECVVKILRAMDRYHGFAAPERAAGRDGRKRAARRPRVSRAMGRRDAAPSAAIASVSRASSGGEAPPIQPPLAQEANTPSAPLMLDMQETTQLSENNESLSRPVDTVASADAVFGPRPAPPVVEVAASDAPPNDRPQMAPQAAEKIEFAPGESAGPEHETCAAPPAFPPEAGPQPNDCAQMAPQASENPQSAPAAADTSNAPDGAAVPTIHAPALAPPSTIMTPRVPAIERRRLGPDRRRPASGAAADLQAHPHADDAERGDGRARVMLRCQLSACAVLAVL